MSSHLCPTPECARTHTNWTWFDVWSHIPPQPRCPSTHVHQRQYGLKITGVQCKYMPDHEGVHCGYVDFVVGEVTWE